MPHCLQHPRRRKYARAAYLDVHMQAGIAVVREIAVDIYRIVMVVTGIMRAMFMLLVMMRVIGIVVIMRVHHRR